MKTIIIKLSIIVLFVLGCKKESIESNEALIVRGGYSFGECLSNCKTTVEISGDKTKAILAAYQYSGSTTATKTCEVAIQAEDVNKAIAGLQFSQFKALQKVYGCPDCADGGAEWIEIQQGSQSYKVTYDYKKPPAEVKEISEFLHKQYLAFRNCK
jgi:hypothetical protein